MRLARRAWNVGIRLVAHRTLPTPSVLPDDHDGAVGVVGDPVGGGAEQVVVQEVSLVTDHDEIGVAVTGVAGDQLGGVAVDFEVDVSGLGLVLGGVGDLGEEAVFLALTSSTSPMWRRRPGAALQ